MKDRDQTMQVGVRGWGIRKWKEKFQGVERKLNND